ncbi:hypothetical protein [Amphritea balenae]|uniref:Uncharacterized protein n=1 Tax=Amphritea balenae TaxID=452629 RepID=A0A3P1SVY2_9GAMM|nr:hypothetical protein [Amphritea balenae]RRD01270.1 hypothetical protein EHS89_01525 [Amphritea balenae]GGK58565.1 hypothetical protein GCM10007941_05930 [Amphritea balenae]
MTSQHTDMAVFGSIGLAIVLTLTPVMIPQATGLDIGSYAIAKGGEGGNGGGNGHGGGKGHGAADFSWDSHGKSNGLGHSKGHGAGHSKGLGNNHGAVASSLGRLNAAHASATARANAAPHSAVGLIAQYEASITAAHAAESEEERTQHELEAMGFLGQAANKELNTEVIEAVNELLDLAEEVSEDTDDGSTDEETGEEQS